MIRRFFYNRRIKHECMHPDHRVQHIHGDERNHGYVAWCRECYWYFKSWPGGSHDATPCKNYLVEQWKRNHG